jgi:ABC-2 type transport system permease protein
MTRWSAFWQLFLAQVREFYREPAAVFWMYGFPVFLAIALGIAFSGGQPEPLVNLGQAPHIAIQNTPDPHEAERLRDKLAAGGLRVTVEDAAACQEQLRKGEITLYVVPHPRPEGYVYYFDPQRPDGARARFQVDDLVQRWKAGKSVWPVHDETHEEPGNRYIDFLIPGLIGFNLMNGGLWGVGYVLVDLRVRRLLKRYRATPMRRSDFLLAIIGSRLLLLLAATFVLALVGRFAFGVPMKDPFSAAFVVILGGVSFAAIGLLIACRSEKTETVAGLINFIVVPMWMLSGTFFPSTRFPDVVQPFVQALPLIQVNDALRALLLEGVPVLRVAWRIGILVGWCVVPFALALRWFRWS